MLIIIPSWQTACVSWTCHLSGSWCHSPSCWWWETPVNCCCKLFVIWNIQACNISFLNRQYSYCRRSWDEWPLGMNARLRRGKVKNVQCLCSDFFEFARKYRNITVVPSTVPTARQRKRTQSNTPKLQVLLFIVFRLLEWVSKKDVEGGSRHAGWKA